jgi:hypothetical protein
MHFGDDPHCLSKFIENGFGIRAMGGSFKFSMNQSQQITTVFIQVADPRTILYHELNYLQTAAMSTYAKAYNDFTIVDGTHNMSMYDLKLIPYTNVDCLGKNVVSGICLDESENGETIAEGLQMFSLARPGATLMSDGGSAYPSCAEAAGMVHILCTQHFQQTVFASSGGLQGEADNFKRDAMALIYATFDSEALWNDKYTAVAKSFSDIDSAMKCLKTIYHHRKKVCRAFTGTSL